MRPAPEAVRREQLPELLPVGATRALLDSVAARLDEGREILRYLGGLLILLGLLGTFWGLIDTLSAIGRVIHLGNRMATADGRLVGPDGKLYAHASTTCFIFDVS